MGSTKLVLFIIEQSPPLYKAVLGGNISHQNGLIALHSENSVDLLSISNKCFVRGEGNAPIISVSTSGTIISFAWNEPGISTRGGRNDAASLALSHVTGNLSIYKIQGTQSICTTELHHLTLKSLLKDSSHIDLPVSKTYVLNFTADKLTILVDRQLVVRLCVSETQPWQIVHTIECPQKVLYGSVTKNTLVLVDSDHSILLYNIINKDFLAVVKREKGKCWNSCRLSTDYLQLTLQNDDGELYSCHLDGYFRKNSTLLNRTYGSQSRAASSDTIHWYSSTSLADDAETGSPPRSFHSSKLLYKIPFAGDCLSYQSTSDHISAICHAKGVMMLVSYCISSGHTSKLEITSEEYVLLSNADTIPHILISDTYVYAAAIGHFYQLYSQTDVTSGTLRAIVEKNGWGEKSSMPNIKQLVTAIENRDSNAVLNHIKLYKSYVEELMATPAVDHRADVESMCGLIYSASSTYAAHSSTRGFALQISEAMLAFLKEQSRQGISMLNEMLMTENIGKRSLMEGLLDKISDHTMSFSDLIKTHAKPEPSTKVKVKSSKTKASAQKATALNEDLIIKWNLLSSKELIGDGVLMGDIALLQSYFKQKNRPSEASWDFIVKIGLQCVLDELEAKNWTTACQMLKNMGFGVFSKLAQIAMYTTDTRLRKYLVAQLQLEGEFSEDEKEAIKFAAEINRLYPCESFKEATAVQQRANLNRLPNADDFAVAKFCGEIGAVSHEITSSQRYSHYMLDWMEKWKSHRDDIFIDRYIHDSETIQELDKVPVTSVWSYLCRHNRVDIITEWIDVLYSGKASELAFLKQPITIEMVDECCASLPVVSKTIVLDYLIQHGVLSTSDSLSPQRKFSALGAAGMLLNREKSGKLISIEEILSHCVENGLLHLLFVFFSMWRITNDEIKSLESTMPGKTFLAVDMFYSFHKLYVHGPDPELILEASLANSRYLCKDPYLTHEGLLDKQLSDVALCNLLYHSPLLEGSKKSLTPDQLAAYKEHRFLKYFFDGMEEASSLDIPDITVYDLVEKWGTLSGQRLFATQIKSIHSSESSASGAGGTEMNNFSNKELVKKCGLEVKLTFMHYLREARPTFAFLTFLDSESCTGSSIPSSRVKLAVKQTHYLAVKRYNELPLVASCSAFLELMGEDSLKLRLLTNAAQIIDAARLQKNPTLDPKVVHSEVESLLLPAVFSTKFSIKDAYEQLVEAADAMITGTSIPDGVKWKVVIDFSHMFNQPLPTRFLEHCAQANEWLSFLVYSQIFDYDLNNYAHIINSFTADGIREHLQCVLETSKQRSVQASLDDNGLMERREQLHNKMASAANKKPKEKILLVSSSDDERKDKHKALVLTLPTVTTPANTNGNILPVEQIPNDIFALLFLTNNKPDSWRLLNSYAVLLENPILSVLAACNKKSATLECLSCWLIASLPGTFPLASELKKPQYGKGFQRKTIIGALSYCIEKHKLLLLKTGLQIFASHCPLVPLLDAYGEMPAQRFFVAASLLTKYKTLMKKSMHAETTKADELTFQELVSLSLHVIRSCMESMQTVRCERFLHLLDETNLLCIFKGQHRNFGYVYKVYKVVFDLRLSGVNCPKLVSAQCMDEIKNVLKILVEKKEFDIARKLSSSCDLDPGRITVQELGSDAEVARLKSSWSKDGTNADFWSRCHRKCEEHDLSPEKCAAFFEYQASLTSTSLQDKIQLSQFAYNWMRQTANAFESENLSRLQKLVWQSQLDLILHKGVTEDPEFSASDVAKRPKATLSIDKTQFLQIESKHNKLLELGKDSAQTPTQLKVALSQMIGNMLDEFRIEEACLVSLEYGYTTQDVVIVQICLGLAMKRLDAEHMGAELTAFLGDTLMGRRRAASTSQGHRLSFSGFDSYPLRSAVESHYEEKDTQLSMLRKIAEKCKYGSKACDKIVSCYSISVALELSYRDTVLQSEYSLLKQLLSSQVSTKYSLALEYIDTCALSEMDVASFLSGHVYNTLQSMTGLQEATQELATDHLMITVEECANTGKELKQLIQLFTEPAFFGQALLDQALRVAIDKPNVKLKLAVKVELLILAHEAYSLAFDMEGISDVLRACRSCTRQIDEVSYHTLMVHMLTGIRRYSEMTYIFETLKQNHQFELLFRKGRAKDNQLKLAVLDYLRRFCPGDHDMYRVVASHFAMYREIASLLEQSAIRKLTAITTISAKNQDRLSTTLSDIQKNLTDATEIYLEGDCLLHAHVCVKLARLVHLQMSLLSTGVQVVNLEPSQVKSFVEQNDKFYHAYTVSDAYDKSYWAAALCNNVIIKGDTKYLNEFKKSIPLTTALVTEVVQRFQLRSDVAPTSHVDNNLRRLLTHCKDVVVKYKLAHSLSLTDVTKELLTADNGVLGAVIRDNVVITEPTQK